MCTVSSCSKAAGRLLSAAHPDDETVGMGATLYRLREAAIIHVTDGAPRDMRDARAQGLWNGKPMPLPAGSSFSKLWRLAVSSHWRPCYSVTWTRKLR